MNPLLKAMRLNEISRDENRISLRTKPYDILQENGETRKNQQEKSSMINAIRRELGEMLAWK